MSSKSNTYPSKELNNILQTRVAAEKNNTHAKVWLEKIKRKTFRKETKGQNESHISTYQFLENTNIEYLSVNIINKKEEKYIGFSYFFDALDENKGSYYKKDEDDGGIYYERYILSYNCKILFCVESKECTYTTISRILWDSDYKFEIAKLVE